MLRRIIALVLSLGLLFQQTGFSQVSAELNLSNYLSGLGSNPMQDRFRPAHLRYFSYDSLNDNFKVLLDKGDLKNLGTKELESSTQTLLNYFLTGVIFPDDTFWVNLRPDKEDQIIDPGLEKTDVGKIMLEADLQLKRDTSRWTSPQTPEGRIYWNKLYQKAGELFGTENVSIPTLTRPWIVPGEIIVRETGGSTSLTSGTERAQASRSVPSAYVYKATLKVMLEQDYLAKSKSSITNATDYSFKDPRQKALNEYSSQLIRELIISKLTKEVNSSKRYAALRQVYYSLILSRWFKMRFAGKSGTYSSLINTRNLTNLTSKTPWSKTSYFKQYQRSFAEGEYNLKEPVYTPTGQVIRSYFSGGVKMSSGNMGMNILSNGIENPGILNRPGTEIIEGDTAKGIGSLSSPLLTQEQIIYKFKNAGVEFNFLAKVWDTIPDGDKEEIGEWENMSAPSKVYHFLLVQVQLGQRLAASPISNSTFREVTN